MKEFVAIELIGICGGAGAGKDTLANNIVQSYPGFEVLSFATPLKELVAKYLGRPINKAKDRHYLVNIGQWFKGRLKCFPEDCIHPAVKKTYDMWEQYGCDTEKEYQILLSAYLLEQALGQSFDTVEFTEDYWLLRLAERTKPGGKYVIPDLRFPVEGEWIKQHGGINVGLFASIQTREERLIDRDGEVPEGIWKAVSETEYDLIPKDFEIEVDSPTPDEVFQQFDVQYRKLRNGKAD